MPEKGEIGGKMGHNVGIAESPCKLDLSKLLLVCHLAITTYIEYCESEPGARCQEFRPVD
jgi:hypothetical protein